LIPQLTSQLHEAEPPARRAGEELKRERARAEAAERDHNKMTEEVLLDPEDQLGVDRWVKLSTV
jgi:hypothetical protein